MRRRVTQAIIIILIIIACAATPQAAWVRWINAGLYALAFFGLGWSLFRSARLGRLSKRTFDIGMILYGIIGLSAWASLYAAKEGYPVPPYITIYTILLFALVVRVFLRLPDEDEPVELDRPPTSQTRP